MDIVEAERTLKKNQKLVSENHTIRSLKTVTVPAILLEF
jgi:hypothetical protein